MVAATLILLDEVMMYARAKAAGGGDWVSHLRNFFQYLTQAVTKIDRAAIVASLLATDPPGRTTRWASKSCVISRTYSAASAKRAFNRCRKKDVAEVLRRRFFEPESIRDLQAYKPHVIGIVKGIAKLDETTRTAKREAEERFLHSFPFHPDLTDVLYSRWTQIRRLPAHAGILRTLATALRDAEPWTGARWSVRPSRLAKPKATAVCEAIRELAGIATNGQR